MQMTSTSSLDNLGSIAPKPHRATCGVEGSRCFEMSSATDSVRYKDMSLYRTEMQPAISGNCHPCYLA